MDIKKLDMQMEHIKGILKKIKDMVKGLMYGMMDVSILVIGKKMKEQVLVNLKHLKVLMKDILKMEYMIV